VCKSVLRPSGSVAVGHQRLDAVSEGEVIAAGRRVVVVGVRGGAVVVREIASSEDHSA